MTMLKSLTLFISLLFLTQVVAQSNSQKTKPLAFPTCEEVLSHVIHYMDRDPTSGIRLSLAKKKEGYFLVVEKNENKENKIVEYLLVWNQLTGEFLVPDWDKYLDEPSSEELISSTFLYAWEDRHNYDFYRYYGYPEASVDLIEDLGRKKDPTLYEYELLARAHSNLAQRYIHPYIGGIPPEFAQNFELSNYEKIAQNRLDKAAEHIQKSLMFWNHIEAVNPNYEPHIITNIHLKIANERMHFWSLYMSVREPELARKIVDEVDYSAVDLAVAKRMLDNCDQNGFLLANGDSDTYPLWYVQEKLNYRSDVQLLNTSLLQTDWYLSMCKSRGMYSTNFTAEDYKRLTALVLIAFNEGEVGIESIIKQTIPELGGKVPEEGYVLVPSNITMDLGKDEPFQLKTSTYLYMWQLALFDIMISNSERSFHSTQGGIIWRSIGLDDQVAPRGSMNELVRGDKYVSNVESEAHVHAKKQLDNMDLTQINDTYLAQLEFRNLVSNIAESHYIFNDEYEALGNQLIDGLSIEFLAKVDDPSLIREVLVLYDALSPEKGVELRDAYLEKADEIIQSLDVSGTDFITKFYAIAGIYSIYSGKELSDIETFDTYKETPRQAAFLKRLKEKLNKIQGSLSSEEQIRTTMYVEFSLSKMDDF